MREVQTDTLSKIIQVACEKKALFSINVIIVYVLFPVFPVVDVQLNRKSELFPLTKIVMTRADKLKVRRH